MFNHEESFYIEKEVAVSDAKAWGIIAEPGGLTHWHPFMEKHVAKSWDGVGSTDHLTYYSGFEFDREVIKWIDGVGYDLRVTENGKRPNRAIWRVLPVDENNCIVRITGEVDFIKKIPFPIRWALLKFKLKPLYTQYLFQILEGLAYYAETGNQVERDQFGPHALFSK